MSASIRFAGTVGLYGLLGSEQYVAPRPWQFVIPTWRRTL
jgi:hypothetical protein